MAAIQRIGPWAALATGSLSGLLGLALVVSLWFAILSPPVLAFAYVRLRWAQEVLLHHVALSRRRRAQNVLASVGSLLAVTALGVALFPGEPLGFGLAVGVVVVEVLTLVALRADGPLV